MEVNPCSPLSCPAHPGHPPRTPAAQSTQIHLRRLPVANGSCWWAGNNSHMSTKAEEHDVFC